MELVIVRHGEAEAYRADDASRALTNKGAAQIRQTAAWLAAQGFVPDCVLASPLIRAQQTAFLLTEALCSAVGPRTEALLVPEADARQAQLFLETLEGRVLLASHMPLVGSLSRALCPAVQLSFTTGTALYLQRAAHGWSVRAAFSPQ